ncbi:MAG: hypothetical protein M3308_05780 [Actinomycetota bacterium]|nr:hypothetical protein [Actinomycetota bacterium]
MQEIRRAHAAQLEALTLSRDGAGFDADAAAEAASSPLEGAVLHWESASI